jgi:hypothetical protein
MTLKRHGSTDALAPQHDLHGLEQDGQVEEQAVVLDVVKVVLEFVQGVLDRGAVGVDLRPAGMPV